MQDVIAAETVAGGGGAGRIQSLPRPERHKWHFQRSKDSRHALHTSKHFALHLDLHMSCNVIHKHCKTAISAAITLIVSVQAQQNPLGANGCVMFVDIGTQN